jgi:hypothetical protein
MQGKRTFTRLPQAAKFKLARWLEEVPQERIDAEKLTRKRLAEIATSVAGTLVTVRHLDGIIHDAELKIRPYAPKINPAYRSAKIEELAVKVDDQAKQIAELRELVLSLMDDRTAPNMQENYT